MQVDKMTMERELSNEAISEKRASRFGHGRTLGQFAAYLAASAFLGFCALPLYILITTAFKTESDTFASPPRFLFEPTFVNLYETFFVFAGRGVFFYLLNSIVITVLSTLVATALGTMCAYGLARYNFRGKSDLAFFIISTRFAPAVAFIVPFFIIARTTGLLDSHFLLILIYTSMNLSFVVWILREFFAEVPVELEEAALMDGYSRWELFTKVALPLVKPGIVATALLSGIFAWNEFLFALMLTQREAATLPVFLSQFSTSMAVRWGPFMTVGLLAVIPVVAVSFAMQRHLVRGLTFGAVK